MRSSLALVALALVALVAVLVAVLVPAFDDGAAPDGVRAERAATRSRPAGQPAEEAELASPKTAVAEAGAEERVVIVPSEPTAAPELEPLDAPPPRPDVTYWGRVVHGAKATPIEGAVVRLFAGELRGGRLVPVRDNPRLRMGVRRLRTDEDGFFRADVFAEERAVVRIEADGFGSSAHPFRPGAPTRSEAQVFRLAAQASLDVRVLDAGGVAERDAPVTVTADAAESFVGDGVYAGGRIQLDARTDGDGWARFESLPPRTPLWLSVGRRSRWRRSEPMVLEPGAAEREIVRVPAGSSVVGRVRTADGSTPEDCHVWLATAGRTERVEVGPGLFTTRERRGARRIALDGSGTFAFHDVAQGEHWVGIGAEPGSRWITERVLVRVEGEGETHEVDLRATPGLYVSGHVRSASGRPVSTNVIGETTGPGAAQFIDRAGSDGRFAVGPFPPGAVRVRLSGDDPFSEAEVTVPAGTEDVELVPRPVALVHGRGVDPQTGEAVPMTRVTFTETSSGEPAGRFFHSGEGFLMSGLAPGTYDVVGRAEDGRVAFDRSLHVLEQGTAPIELTVSEPGTVWVDFRGEPGTELTVRALVGGTPVATARTWAGTRRPLTVPPGELTIVGTLGGAERDRATVHVGVGASVELVLR